MKRNMAKAQPKQTKRPGRWRRFSGWFRRHKITAVFASLVLALVLYLFGSWAVLQVQIHFERERFLIAQADLRTIADNVFSKIKKPEANIDIRSCSYTNVVIGLGSRSCNIDVYSTFSTNDKNDAIHLSQLITNNIMHSYKITRYSNPDKDVSNINTYNLNLANNLNCFVDYWYFQGKNIPFTIPGFKFNTEQGLFMQLNCGGGAKAEYFPVSNN